MYRQNWIWAVAGATALLAACAPAPPEVTSGRAQYETFCLACHGEAGRGDGPLAESLTKRPADLTGIAARNGGVFPMARVMSTIDGYSRRNDLRKIMPQLGSVFANGPMVLADTGDGIATPVPEALLDIAQYLRSIQTP